MSSVSQSTMPESLQERYALVRDRIAAAAARAGHRADDIILVAVTKFADHEQIRAMIDLGHRDFGENKVQTLMQHAAMVEEYLARLKLLKTTKRSQPRAGGELLSAVRSERAAQAHGHAEPPETVRWHMIGHLQRNKARRALEHAAAVHSIDTLRLLEALSRLCGELGREIDVFLELRAIESGERTGFGPAELPAAVELAARLPHLRLRGLMAMAAPDPLARAGELSSQSNARRTFASVRELGSRLPVDAFVGKRVEYSMGMSGDLEAAIQEGAHWVRIGTALFENVAEERP